LFLWPWPWPDDLDILTRPRYCEDAPTYQMKFLGLGFQKLQHEQDRQTHMDTHRRGRTQYHAAFTAGNKCWVTCHLWRFSHHRLCNHSAVFCVNITSSGPDRFDQEKNIEQRFRPTPITFWNAALFACCLTQQVFLSPPSRAHQLDKHVMCLRRHTTTQQTRCYTKNILTCLAHSYHQYYTPICITSMESAEKQWSTLCRKKVPTFKLSVTL